MMCEPTVEEGGCVLSACCVHHGETGTFILYILSIAVATVVPGAIADSDCCHPYLRTTDQP